MYREGISRSGLCWLRCIYLRTPCEESQRRRRSAKNAAMDKVEPEKHPLDLSIVRSLNLNQNGFEACALSEALATGYRNAAHAMLWAPADMLVMQRYQQKAIVLAVVRFDGYLGFPGGMVDPGESPAQAVNRELREELNADTSRFWATESDHVISFRQQERRFACHLYALRVSSGELLATERAAIGSREPRDAGHPAGAPLQHGRRRPRPAGVSRTALRRHRARAAALRGRQAEPAGRGRGAHGPRPERGHVRLRRYSPARLTLRFDASEAAVAGFQTNEYCARVYTFFPPSAGRAAGRALSRSE